MIQGHATPTYTAPCVCVVLQLLMQNIQMSHVWAKHTGVAYGYHFGKLFCAVYKQIIVKIVERLDFAKSYTEAVA